MNWASSTPVMDSKERGPEFLAPTPSVPLNVKPKSPDKTARWNTSSSHHDPNPPRGSNTSSFFLLWENLSHCRPTHSIFKEKYGKDASLHLEWSTSQHCRPPLRLDSNTTFLQSTSQPGIYAFRPAGPDVLAESHYSTLLHEQAAGLAWGREAQSIQSVSAPSNLCRPCQPCYI